MLAFFVTKLYVIYMNELFHLCLYTHNQYIHDNIFCNKTICFIYDRMIIIVSKYTLQVHVRDLLCMYVLLYVENTILDRTKNQQKHA